MDDAGVVHRPVQVRTDSAGCTDFVWHARNRNIGSAVGARSNANIHAALSRVAFDDESWHPALRQDGEERAAQRWPSSPATSTCRAGRRGPG